MVGNCLYKWTQKSELTSIIIYDDDDDDDDYNTNTMITMTI